jgi:hypothetical protein
VSFPVQTVPVIWPHCTASAWQTVGSWNWELTGIQRQAQGI